ncbi:NAD(P)H-binding protein [Actinotalea sp. M2MS4P-6]|uniref:SDR family oxidoreductase n=1 Tax=Actinotalea sp. M2MS4P-6 TaxID=2983762 RepID=UPI0021E41339|nr:NAD(P)H-binding protein [Actinotalea sp. M2MS4P-6]MCV2395748.1 NAD(P)H-binding protein [Actinotalea sp. M2MS4P-6]
MISVVGGTGRLGAALVPMLTATGAEVRVVSRRGDLPGGLGGLVRDVVRADVREPASLAAAVAGAELVVSAVHGLTGRGVSPESVDHRGNVALVDAARAGGAGVVLVSVRGAGPAGNELQRAKWRAEEHLRASGIPWTVVRAPAYLELWQDVLRRSAGRGGRPVVLGRGVNPIAMVGVDAVARAVADVCLDDRLRGRVVDLPADQNLTLDALAASISASGTRPRHVPLPVVRALGQLLRPVSPGAARVARLAIWMDTAPLQAPGA